MSRRSVFLSMAVLSIMIVASIVMARRDAVGVRTALAADDPGSVRGAAPGAAPGAVPGAGALTAVLAGGCYWGVESVFDHVRGVKSVTSGFAIPVTVEGERFEGAAEAVRIEYDTSVVSYRQLLDIFFSVVHDPTQLNRQGPDVGPNYRSIVFADGDQQREVVRAYIDSLSGAHMYSRPIVTRIAALQSFQAADPSQQHYAERHPYAPYIVINDVPKVKALKERFPTLYRERR